jgi:hypothetical protein
VPTKKTKTTKQSKRFIEAAREAECSEDEVVFDENLKRIVKAKPKPGEAPHRITKSGDAT